MTAIMPRLSQEQIEELERLPLDEMGAALLLHIEELTAAARRRFVEGEDPPDILRDHGAAVHDLAERYFRRFRRIIAAGRLRLERAEALGIPPGPSGEKLLTEVEAWEADLTEREALLKGIMERTGLQ
jgi:hypothetical protein